jgi:hypothetical protein
LSLRQAWRDEDRGKKNKSCDARKSAGRSCHKVKVSHSPAAFNNAASPRGKAFSSGLWG